MSAVAAHLHLEPTMIAGDRGPLFAVHYAPTLAQHGRAAIYLPPFAEELNRSRKMASLQARALAAAGIGVLVLDPYGCGDSAGDFRDARWDRNISDHGREARSRCPAARAESRSLCRAGANAAPG